MIDKLTDAIGDFSARRLVSALLSTSVLALPIHAAEQEWWFDIEVILFERNLDTANISEKFEQSELEQPPSDYLDLITPYLKPDLSYLKAGLPYCRASNQLAVKKQYEKDFAFPLPANKTDNSSSPQPDERPEQNQQTNSEVVDNSNEIPNDNFQYEVATTDIFAQSDDSIPLVQTAPQENNSTALSELISDNRLEQQANREIESEINLPKPPIQIEFVEWEIPNRLPCAYAEQIDASFASITSLQNDALHNQPSNKIERVPEIIDGKEWRKKRSAFLLPASTMRMTELYDKIKKQRDITPILHVNWRQEVKFGRDKGQTFRLFAGKNFAEKFDANGIPIVEGIDGINKPINEFYIPEQELAGLNQEQQQALLADINGTQLRSNSDDLFTQIAKALTDETPINFNQTEALAKRDTAETDSVTVKELWQLDGGITVYLRNLGRVPYLHIDSNLDFRQPIFDPEKIQKIKVVSDDLSNQGAIAVNQPQLPNYLQSVNFNQLRRVISKQVHYFDHPLFGMIVRINRYKWPEVEQEEVEALTN